MPKRTYPFEFDFLPQLKMHISEKEVNTGVLTNSHMQVVYDKTMGLLFKGAKSYSHVTNNITSCITSHPKGLSPEINHSKHLYKQMFLTKDCQLHKSGTLKLQSVHLCGSCSIVSTETMNTCTFCDKTLCSVCLAICSKCNEGFCKSCSLITYNDEDSCLCLNCCR